MEGIYRRLAHNMAEISAPSRKMHAVCRQLHTRRLQWLYFKQVEKRLSEEILPHIGVLSADNVTAYALAKGEIVQGDADLVHAAGSLNDLRRNASMAYNYLPSLRHALTTNMMHADFGRLERLDRVFQLFRKAVEFPLTIMAGAVALGSATALILPRAIPSEVRHAFTVNSMLSAIACYVGVVFGFKLINVLFNPDTRRLRKAIKELEQSILDAQRPLKEIIDDTSLFRR